MRGTCVGRLVHLKVVKRPQFTEVLTMINTGEELENFVRDIEKSLLPGHFKVETRKQAHLNNGSSLAEFDVHITGELGSTTIKWDIECRDRPSEGPAGEEWIEQLIGRKRVHKFDKVFAVSTTGFSSGAQSTAAGHEIILRTVTRITDISKDFEVIPIGLIDHHMQLLDPIHCDRVIPDVPGDHAPWDPRLMSLRIEGESEFQDFSDFFVAHVDPTKVDLNQHGPVQFNFTIKGSIEVVIDSQRWLLENPTMSVQSKRTDYPATVLTARRYEEGERVIANDGLYVVDDPQGRVVWRVRVMDRPDGTHVTEVVREDDSPVAPMLPRKLRWIHR